MLNPIEEAKFQELKDKCRELRVPPPPDLFIGLQVHDENGILVFDDMQRGHSWTRNFWNMAFYCMSSGTFAGGASYGAGYMTGKNTGGGVVATGHDTVPYWSGGAGSVFGIVVGTGDTAFSIEQYALAAVISHGSSAGTFAYVAQGAFSTSYTAGSKSWKTAMSRIFNNNSGGSITVKETGIYSNNGRGIMVERSVLSPTVTVATGGQLTVTYEISMDFSAID